MFAPLFAKQPPRALLDFARALLVVPHSLGAAVVQAVLFVRLALSAPHFLYRAARWN